jgi:hypothetical protein
MNAAIPERRPVTEEISGLIERVTFHNDENGFCVFRIKTKEHREETTVVGSLPSVTAGEWLAAEGWWVRDKEHGLQFKASTMKTVPPTTAEGIERYLGSGLVKGIGPFLAKKLVGRFGTEVLAVIENRAAELYSVAICQWSGDLKVHGAAVNGCGFYCCAIRRMKFSKTEWSDPVYSSEVGLFDSFELRGKWWLPDAPDDRVHGTVTYSPAQRIKLRLDGKVSAPGVAQHLCSGAWDGIGPKRRERIALLGWLRRGRNRAAELQGLAKCEG